LIFLFSFSGIVTFIFSSVFTFIIFTLKTRLLFIKSISLLFLIIILIVPVLIFYRQFKFFYSDGGAYARPFENYTFSGNPYFHDTVRKDIENGNRVWVYVCEDELRKEWNRVSAISYDSLDMKGQYLKYTLIRYLTSAGLRKDSAGLSYLTPADIGNVERGITNKMFSFWGPWKSKLYEIIWQIDYYKNGGNPSGHSITQRIEFVKTGWHIFLRYPVFGTGTGDLRKEYLMQYEIDNSPLNPAYRLLSHNQFITFLASFGITGIIIICFSILFPCIAQGALKRYLPVLFILIIIISMLWEDTLESHTGVSFFAYFYSLFVFGYEETDVRGTEKIY
ncbi:MAG: O-antigen ligase family protein, partial [Bacteroidales bacterium]